MSKHFAAAFFALLLILQIFNNCFGQNPDVTISIRSVSPPIAEIRGSFAQSSIQKNFSIDSDSVGTSNLAERVSDIRLEDNQGKPVAFKQFIPGEYVAEREYSGWSYRLDLTPQKRAGMNAHVSWIGNSDGLLFLDDLLPLQASKECAKTRIEIHVPDGWKVFGNEDATAGCSAKSVYYLSKRSRTVKIGAQTPADLIISGDWKFSEQQAAGFVNEIYSKYKELFGSAPPSKSHVYIIPFPTTVSPGNWEADTRGGTVTILSSDMPFQTQSVQRLHEQLRHEIFHLWMPNAVHLKGNYDWFYEGFALYESLKLGVDLNRLRFDDMLDTLSRAMTFDAAFADSRSLIAASKARVTGEDTRLYARGMLIAFLTDLKMISRTHGKEDVTDLLRTIYNKYKDAKNESDGNQAVLAAISDDEIRRYVENGGPINWDAIMNSAGIEKADEKGSISLRSVSKPNGSQKKFLDKLGYNNWRKSSVAPK
jgi:hypothetical protein